MAFATSATWLIRHCTQVIDKGGLKFGGRSLHVECFRCAYCDRQLDRDQFTSRDGKEYCRDCYALHLAKRCDRCQNPITGNS